MSTILDENKELVTLLASNNELQKIFTRIAIQLVTAGVISVKDQKPVGVLLGESAIILEKNEIFLTRDELKEAVTTWAGRKIHWRIEKI